jgi:hypothetical protein
LRACAETRDSDFCKVCAESLVQFVLLDAVSAILVRAPQVGRSRQSPATRVAGAGARSLNAVRSDTSGSWREA